MADSEIVRRLLQLSKDNKLESGEDLLELRSSASEVVELAGKLDWSPRKNWVEDSGGLPQFIEKIAIGIMKGTGKPREVAIPMAIEQVKRWASGQGNVNADTRAKAAAAVAEWEALKAKNKARMAAKKAKN